MTEIPTVPKGGDPRAAVAKMSDDMLLDVIGALCAGIPGRGESAIGFALGRGRRRARVSLSGLIDALAMNVEVRLLKAALEECDDRELERPPCVDEFMEKFKRQHDDWQRQKRRARNPRRPPRPRRQVRNLPPRQKPLPPPPPPPEDYDG